MSRVDWLFLDLNSFFASCEQQDDARLRGKPVAVVPSLSDTTSVIAASYLAKAMGVRTGVRVRDARQMCPGIIFRTGNHKRYVQYHHRVRAAIETVLPVEQVCSIDEFACRLLGTERHVPDAEAIAMLVKDAIRTQVGEAITCSIGLAPNRFLAKVAADMKKPDGLTVLTKESLPGKLLTQKLQDLPGIGPRMAQRLINHGITSVAELWAADMHTLRAIWGGIEGEKFYAKLRGEEVFYRPTHTSSFSHQHVLEPDFRTPHGMRAYAHHLLAKLGERLRAGNFLCRRLALSVRYVDFTRAYKETSFHETNDSLTLLRILNTQLLGALPQRKPFKVGIVASDFIPVVAQQMDLFAVESKNQLSATLDTLNGKYGRGTLYFGVTQALQQQMHAKIAFQRVPDESEFGDDVPKAMRGRRNRRTST